jgi:hypothetical protein
MAISGPAQAVVFATAGDTAIIDFNGLVDGNPDADLDADLTLTLLSITGSTDFNFSYSLENNSSGDDLGARLTAFGFNVDPNFDDATVSGFFTNWSSGNVPGGLPNVEFCATSGANCSGGAGGGVAVGDTGDGLLTLSFLVAPTAGIDLTDFYVRYQSLGPNQEGSGVGVGTPCIPGEPDCNGGGGGNVIPEPSTWVLMILGFGGAGAMLRRRRTAMTPA